jgi:anti-anti-sigma regulatory factor
MLKIVRSVCPDCVKYILSGRIDAEQAAELQSALDGESLPVILDLGEVRRFDREVMETLAGWEMKGIRLENCPAYVLAWIAKLREPPG